MHRAISRAGYLAPEKITYLGSKKILKKDPRLHDPKLNMVNLHFQARQGVKHRQQRNKNHLNCCKRKMRYNFYDRVISN